MLHLSVYYTHQTSIGQLNCRCLPVHTNIRHTKRFIDRVIAGPYNGIQDFSVSLYDDSDSAIDPTSTQSATHVRGAGAGLVVIGYAGIRDENELGFIFNRNYWGKGYATEAVNAILTCFWGERANRRVVVKADVDPRNEASLHLLKKLGFVVVGVAKKTFHTHIGWCDSVYLEARRKSRK